MRQLPPCFLIVGGSLTGNKGAASMTLGLAEGLRRRVQAEVVVLTSLPSADRGQAARHGLRIVPYTPAAIILSLPSAVVYRFVSRRLPATAAVRAFATAAAVADVSGISFSDGRGAVTLAYNVLLPLPALILGTPIVKVSQAMGPFQRIVNRFAALLVLPRLNAILARGRQTQRHLDDVGVRNEGCAADAAFLLKPSIDRTKPPGERPPSARGLIAFAPSQVLANRLAKESLDYFRICVELVNHLTRSHDVVLLAHSARPGKPSSRINDLPLCERVLAAVRAPHCCTIADAEGDPHFYRTLLSECRLVITSRFHVMISALSVCRTPVVLGWGHKYGEVLSAFAIPEAEYDLSVTGIDTMLNGIDALLLGTSAIEDRIRRHLPDVVSSAERNVDAVLSCARGVTDAIR
ncbi:polysaccharide pyruvyl transferase family protein [Thiohalocapsa sp. ML1]|uniref:polysaccharide pyruvyl transferase family protein n=1 Tax=Thiohalocapsa sp. ML1 TaxID=1431688 RepID=UPI001C1FB5B7|nr:polysaccharide pyruvyl transferase family protein [Thiohalocapsa sp. ML1]